MSRCDWIIACCLAGLTAFVMALGPVMLLTGGRAPEGGLVLVVGRNAGDLIAGIGGAAIGPFQAPFGVLAQVGPDDADTLRELGALAVLDGRRIAMICGIDV